MLLRLMQHLLQLTAARHFVQASFKAHHMHADLRTLENRPRRDGKRSQPSRLTGHQQQVIQRLIEAHGQDVEVSSARYQDLTSPTAAPLY